MVNIFNKFNSVSMLIIMKTKHEKKNLNQVLRLPHKCNTATSNPG